MDQILTVKKNTSHRIVLRTLSIIVISICGMYIVSFRQLLMILVFVPGILIVSAVSFYYETWRVSFYSSEIVTSVFFIKTGRYKYTQISDVIKAYSLTDRTYIEVFFSNGKRIKFRLEDENAPKAIRKIQSKHSIRMVN